MYLKSLVFQIDQLPKNKWYYDIDLESWIERDVCEWLTVLTAEDERRVVPCIIEFGDFFRRM